MRSDFDALLARPHHLDQRQLTLERHALEREVSARRWMGTRTLELMLDLLDDRRRSARHDGDARQMLLVLRLRHREAVDVVAASGEKTDDPRQHARLVVDQNGQRP